ncbi:hypothetical protein GCM10009798_16990 [Nocardioides panacihumi]|uniref:Amine oxidase domain-containing protein n=1 Tax=Nocardioides panacihumi TaxID=400774 RepID=A0ABP5C7M1_9ACTN
MQEPRVAVIGSGVSGLVAAYACATRAHVTLYEADERLGGHADTHDVVEGDRKLAIDTGFIVHNGRTYPTLTRVFDELGIATQASEMSMSIVDDLSGIGWAGARGWRGLLPDARHLRDVEHLRMLLDIPRFHRRARRLLRATGSDLTLGEFLREGRFSAHFVRHFAEPLVAAVWSCDPQVARDYPARYLFQFLDHHGMLAVSGSPTWRTVTGGSREYVTRIAERLDEVRLGARVVEVTEHADRVSVRDGRGDPRHYDKVVIATHPHQALAMLAAPTPEQREVLGAITYSANTALLHTDTSLLPADDRVRASWNFRRTTQEAAPVTVTYDLTRLQRLDTDVHYLVTLGGEDLVDPSTVIARRDYEHPLYTPTSVAAQSRLGEIETARIAFAGAYHGWGFHEDGARAGVAAAGRLGFSWGTPGEPAPRRVYETRVSHVRRVPWRRTFTHRSTMWVVDLDSADRGSRWSRWWRGSIEGRDHLGDPALTVRENLARFLALEGVDLGDARVLLAAHPRAFGFCFNPISVFWCTRRDGTPLATVVEVHNTYGDRHAYVVHPDTDGRARVDKRMYVSPFHGVDGTYELRVPPPGERLHIAVELHTDDGAAFSAALVGERADPGPVRVALSGLLDALRIRVHGIALWAHRLPIRPRPPHHQRGVR